MILFCMQYVTLIFLFLMKKYVILSIKFYQDNE